MHHLADDVFQLPGKPRNMINIYLIEDVLVDSGTPKAGKRIFQALGDRVPTSHLVTHAHPDHFGSSAEVCRKFDIPLLCGEKDVDAVESGRPEASDTVVGRRILSKMPPIPGHPVSSRLKEGDMVGNFEVLDVPGHSRGHIALWRKGDRTLVLADVMWNLNVLTMRSGLREPPKVLTLNPAQNRDSARKLARWSRRWCCSGTGRC